MEKNLEQEIQKLREELELTANLNLVLAAKVAALEKTLITSNPETYSQYTEIFTEEISNIYKMIKEGSEQNEQVN